MALTMVGMYRFDSNTDCHQHVQAILVTYDEFDHFVQLSFARSMF